MSDKILNREGPNGAQIIYEPVNDIAAKTSIILPGKPVRYIHILTIFAALLFQPSISYAQPVQEDQTELPVVRLDADHREVHVGDNITIYFKVTYQEGYDLVGSLVFPEVEGLEPVHAEPELPEDEEKAGNVDEVAKVFKAGEEGEFIIDPITVEFTTPEGKSIDVKSNGLMIVVLTEGAPEEGLRDIKALRKLALPINWLNLSVIIISVVALILLLYFVAGMWPRGEKRVIHPLPENLEELYIGKLGDLKIPDEFDSGAVMVLYLQMSAIIREYLSVRWKITASMETTSEILAELERAKFGKQIEDSYSDVARAFDMVKYAKGRPFRENIEAAKEAAMDFILQMSGARR